MINPEINILISKFINFRKRPKMISEITKVLNINFLHIPPPGCGGTIDISDIESTGLLNSPNFPSPFPSGTCVWRLRTVAGYVVHLDFMSFQLQNNISSCDNYLMVCTGLSVPKNAFFSNKINLNNCTSLIVLAPYVPTLG